MEESVELEAPRYALCGKSLQRQSVGNVIVTTRHCSRHDSTFGIVESTLLKLVTGNGEQESGNECTAVTRLRIQNGGGNDVYKH